MKKIVAIFSGIPATIISGICLLTHLIPHLTEHFGNNNQLNILPFNLVWITLIISGTPLVYSAIKKLIRNKGIGKISSSLLITIAMISAIIINDLFAAGEIAFIMAIGEILEDKTTEKAKKGLADLISLTPAKARILNNGNEESILVDNIRVNDILRILPGETIPVDGVIINGESSVNQSVLTGESLPVDKKIGDEVFCGTINMYGSIDVRATKENKDTSLQKFIKMVKETENTKAPMARIADKAASYLVPISLLIAIITGIITKNIERAVTVLVVFCPCALVLATPTAIMAAIGQATKQGVIIKSGEALEKMSKVNIIASDKTGTLTYGELEVTDVILFEKDISKDYLLSLVASAEKKSEHPLGKAIVNYANNNNITISDCKNFKMWSGKGVTAEINENKIICGNLNFINENQLVVTKEMDEIAQQLSHQGKALIYVADADKVLGIIALSDIIRENAKNTIEALNRINTEIILLTGDNEKTANYFANQLLIKNVKAQLLPDEKAKTIQELQSDGKTVCMVGDGINDALSLKIADVGISMGKLGSDISVESADIILTNDNISKLSYIKKLSLKTVRTIKCNISLSMIINIIAVILSVLGVLNPTTGVLIHNAGSILVIMLSAMLYNKRI